MQRFARSLLDTFGWLMRCTDLPHSHSNPNPPKTDPPIIQYQRIAFVFVIVFTPKIKTP